MKVIIGADHEGMSLKDVVKADLIASEYDVQDVSETPANDFIDATVAVSDILLKDEDSLGIVIDSYGVGSFMAATKIKGMIAAEVSDERSAYMTREHNNARIITMGKNIVGEGLAKAIAHAFLEAHYDGGRHQIRVDMLNKMC
ncbi:galactose-6-phosphate isomerase subunit LacA [Staphylococcus massiliensis]|uniref:Galactose-6-phosphate isomerase subunit LacA n=1 Tax=Staphylococcus massiliensis S46 TaxID=1229783 RepID=K9AW52_9STAP|nr:galactose-6-phosphate isomerase subunit LacA [Staphylococcus massiliensis]EKU45730.1 galactose-6-phosphate isomerase subunit LacA [Staphylococcus massiliensis S46]MCG3400417.1 galactose-6-phosphate isomerase subunit LacA [Staphylococcus massiliensis]MCG3401738.1 galactose-6-phosphate isomerase subunit LacA [Staphylococcus massiliensis]MCG3413489.1 galactose-6-phosphate isomerase subunit LacA [Staphylococcus massiliensis]POA01333.1 galactose-6-phosphate isomerase subunit LacA [Staphylococcus